VVTVHVSTTKGGGTGGGEGGGGKGGGGTGGGETGGGDGGLKQIELNCTIVTESENGVPIVIVDPSPHALALIFIRPA
jgi:hypothetical protein